MYEYKALREIDCYVFCNADTIWTKPSRIIDQIIVAKAAYTTLSDLGDRIPLLMVEAEEIQEAKEDLSEVRNELTCVKKELRKVKKELKQTKPTSTGSKISRFLRNIFSEHQVRHSMIGEIEFSF